MASAVRNHICSSLDEESGGCSSSEFMLHYGGCNFEATSTVPDEAFRLSRPLRGPLRRFKATRALRRLPFPATPSLCTRWVKATMGSPLGIWASPGQKIHPSGAK